MAAVTVGTYLLLFLLIQFIPPDAIDFGTLAPGVSILSICMSTLAVVIGRRSARPANERTITITIEDFHRGVCADSGALGPERGRGKAAS